MDNKKESVTTISRLVESSTAEAVKDIPLKSSANVVKEAGLDSARISSKKVYLLERLKAKDMLVPGSSLGPLIQDDYRRIKRPLVSNACGRDKSMVEHGNLILVTSSVPGEGKTFTSVNLALSIANEKDITTLLVDCDVAKQGVSRMLGLNNIHGLVDVLESDDLSIGDVMLQTDIPNLRVVSAGRHNEYVTELLASQRMIDLVNEIATRYNDRIIIFDGPPLLATPQAQVLAGLVGQVVFVIEAGKTPQSVVEEALGLIPKDQATGLVMNKNEGLFGRSGYYYGYYGPDESKPDNDKKR
jgi:exopolysaccharide/PEP-CTERM locus tyrosine autokinase